MRIAWFIHGRGRGHASRSAGIIAAARACGASVTVLAGGDALDLLREDPDLIPTAPVIPGPSAARSIVRRLYADRRLLRRAGYEWVVSDGDMPGLIAARSLGLRTIVLGHDLVFSHCALPPGLDRHLLWKQRLNGAHLACAQRGVAVHFLPIDAARKGFVAARPDLRVDLRNEVTGDGSIVAYFRDDNANAVLTLLAGTGRRIVRFGGRSPSPRGVEDRPFDPSGFASALSRCSAVVGSSGSNLLAECVQLGKPVLALHRSGDAEQSLNGAMIEHSGVGLAARFDRLDRRTVECFLRNVDERCFRRVSLSHMPTASEAMLRILGAGRTLNVAAPPLGRPQPVSDRAESRPIERPPLRAAARNASVFAGL